MELSDLRCIFCNGVDLHLTQKEEIKCYDCGYIYSQYKGQNFLGAYSDTDTLGLLEVTSKLSATIDARQQREKWDAAEVQLEAKYRSWKAAGYPLVSKNEKFGSNEQAANIRLREWGAFEILAEGLRFHEAKVLDVGAGLGADAIRLVSRGARVTCIDFNPTSIYLGNQIVPEARWIGATSECLPFKDNTFDFAVANAAMHHMADFQKTFDEMLRVTRTGGMILMVSDPFMERQKSANYREDVELKIFARHPMVLSGVNEGLLPINQYFDCLSKCENVEILTMRIHNSPELEQKPLRWKFSEQSYKVLAQKRGNINALMTVPKVNVPTKTTEEFIPAKQFFKVLDSPSRSCNYLTKYLPDYAFDRFPFASITKFDLMNGWLPDSSSAKSGWMDGYNRMRIFMTNEFLQKLEGFQIKRKNTGSAHLAQIAFLVNSVEIKSQPVSPDLSMVVKVDKFEEYICERNVIEIRVKDGNEEQGAIWSTFNKNRILTVRIF